MIDKRDHVKEFDQALAREKKYQDSRHSTDTPSPLTPDEVTAEFEQLERDKRDGLLCPRLVHNPSSPCSCYVKTQYTGPTHTLAMAIVYCDLHDSRKLTEHAVRVSTENARLREALKACYMVAMDGDHPNDHAPVYRDYISRIVAHCRAALASKGGTE